MRLNWLVVLGSITTVGCATSPLSSRRPASIFGAPSGASDCANTVRRLLKEDSQLTGKIDQVLESVKELDNLDRLEEASQRLQSLRGSSVDQAEQAYIKNLTNELHGWLAADNFDAAFTRLQPIWQKNEEAVAMLIALESHIPQVEAMPSSVSRNRLLEKLRQYHDSRSLALGRTRAVYEHSRLFLEASETACVTANCQQAAKKLIESLGLKQDVAFQSLQNKITAIEEGINALRTGGKDYEIAGLEGVPSGFAANIDLTDEVVEQNTISLHRSNYERPSLEDSRRVFLANPLALRAQKWSALRLEILTFVVDFFSEPVFTRLFIKASKALPFMEGLANNPVVMKNFLKETINLRAQFLHFSNITRLVRSPELPILQKLIFVQELGAKDPDFLVSLARRLDSRALWFELYGEASKPENAQLYGSFAKRMEEIRQPGGVAETLGDLPSTIERSPLKNFAWFVATISGGGYGYERAQQWLERAKPDLQEESKMADLVKVIKETESSGRPAAKP